MPQRTEDLLAIAGEMEEEQSLPTKFDDSYGTDLVDDDEEPEDTEDPEDRLQVLVQRAAEEALLWREEDLDFEQAKATDYYICKGGGEEVHEPRFTFHGFQYVEITGCPAKPDHTVYQQHQGRF